jgi:ketosteroid isomerase-like protein
LWPWAHDPAGNTGSVAGTLIQLIDLRLPLSDRICAIVEADGLALVLGERKIEGTGPDCQRIHLSGSGATVVRRQPGGSWRIAADAWYLREPGVDQA